MDAKSGKAALFLRSTVRGGQQMEHIESERDRATANDARASCDREIINGASTAAYGMGH